MAGRILVSQPGIEPMPPAAAAEILIHWTTREVPRNDYFMLVAHRQLGSLCMYLQEKVPGCPGTK